MTTPIRSEAGEHTRRAEVPRKRILVTGGRGYLGSILTQHLSERGHEVVVLDNGAVSGPTIDSPAVSYHCADVRFRGEWDDLFVGVTSVVHLAAVVGDAACDVHPKDAWATNYLGTIRVAEACRRHGVKTLAFASSCSTYGMTDDEEVGVFSPLQPQSTYADTKARAEHHLLSLGSNALSVQILRLATLHGLSPRMRFDLAVNRMTADAVTRGHVIVRGGRQWRPFLHVRDAARAFRLVIERATVGRNCLYNVGSSDQNFRLVEVARIVAEVIPSVTILIQDTNDDGRNYRVNFDAIVGELGFAQEFGLRESIREIADALLTGSHHDPYDARYSNFLLAAAGS